MKEISFEEYCRKLHEIAVGLAEMPQELWSISICMILDMYATYDPSIDQLKMIDAIKEKVSEYGGPLSSKSIW